MSNTRLVISIHPQAPTKPEPGAPCNGCGVCCLVAPCPLGAVLSRRRQGACEALRWHGDARQYRCGALSEPADVLHRALPRRLGFVVPYLSTGMARLAKRWIAVGLGCDSTVELSAVDG